MVFLLLDYHLPSTSCLGSSFSTCGFGRTLDVLMPDQTSVGVQRDPLEGPAYVTRTEEVPLIAMGHYVYLTLPLAYIISLNSLNNLMIWTLLFCFR